MGMERQMTIADLRAEKGWTLDVFAREVGLKSRGFASQVESGKAQCSVSVAARIEQISGGRILAASLNEDVAMLDQVRGSVHISDDSGAVGAASSGKSGDLTAPVAA